MVSPVTIVGGGLAGSECAYQLAKRGIAVVLAEMRPERSTPAHSTGRLAELVCSNSLRSDDPLHAAGLLKREMERFDSLIISAARRSAVPAGAALAVDRDLFAETVTETLTAMPSVEIVRREITQIPDGEVVLATGPLTSPALSQELGRLLGSEHLFFYDAIAPIVDRESLDMSKLFWASRYGKGGADYLNAPMDRNQYLVFHRQLTEAEVVSLADFEQRLFFEGCLPIEELARRGVDTLRFGPMKPVGLTAPDGSKPYAVVQMRQENLAKSHLNLVGFQARMRWRDQKRVFRLIPGLEQAEFIRLGQVHRNTFINAPIHLDGYYRLHRAPHVRIAGQITGVEGYLESAATGLAAAMYMALERQGRVPELLPSTTALGALARHLTESDADHYQPSNINFGLFAELEKKMPRKARNAAYAERSRRDLESWAARHEVGLEEIVDPHTTMTAQSGEVSTWSS